MSYVKQTEDVAKLRSQMEAAFREEITRSGGDFLAVAKELDPIYTEMKAAFDVLDRAASALDARNANTPKTGETLRGL